EAPAPHLPGSCPTAAEARLIPPAPAAALLIPQPAPGRLDGDRPDMPTSRLADPLFPALVATLVRRRREPRRRPDLLAVPEPAPPEELVHIDPRAGWPDRAQAEQLPDFVNSLAVPVGNRALTFAFQLENPRAQELRVLPFPLQPGPQRRGHGRAVPQATVFAAAPTSVPGGSQRPWFASRPFIRFATRVRSCFKVRSSRCSWRRSSSSTVGTRTTLHTARSPAWYRSSIPSSLRTSRASDFARRSRRFPSMLDEST